MPLASAPAAAMPAAAMPAIPASVASVAGDALPATETGDLPTRLRLTATRLARRLRQEGGTDATPSTLSALSSIEARGPLTMGELATVEQIAPPTLTRIVSRLEDQGLVERTVDRRDRRVARMSVTPAGSDLLARARTRKDAWLATRIAGLSPEDRALVAAALPVVERLVGG